MNVIDASVVVDAVAVRGSPGDAARRVVSAEPRLHIPAALAAEVTSALRGMHLRGDLSAAGARTAALGAAAMRARRYPFEPFVARVWELRDVVTVYDAWYVALAEALGAPLVTADDRLRRSVGPHCPILSPAEALGS